MLFCQIYVKKITEHPIRPVKQCRGLRWRRRRPRPLANSYVTEIVENSEEKEGRRAEFTLKKSTKKPSWGLLYNKLRFET